MTKYARVFVASLAEWSMLLAFFTNITLGIIGLQGPHTEAYLSCGLYYTNITIVNDTTIIVRMMIVSDAPRYCFTYNCHSDDTRDVIYAPREHL